MIRHNLCTIRKDSEVELHPYEKAVSHTSFPNSFFFWQVAKFWVTAWPSSTALSAWNMWYQLRTCHVVPSYSMGFSCTSHADIAKSLCVSTDLLKMNCFKQCRTFKTAWDWTTKNVLRWQCCFFSSCSLIVFSSSLLFLFITLLLFTSFITFSGPFAPF